MDQTSSAFHMSIVQVRLDQERSEPLLRDILYEQFAYFVTALAGSSRTVVSHISEALSRGLTKSHLLDFLFILSVSRSASFACIQLDKLISGNKFTSGKMISLGGDHINVVLKCHPYTKQNEVLLSAITLSVRWWPGYYAIRPRDCQGVC